MATKLDADVVVIGGGAVGAACTYLFSKVGLSVILLEKEKSCATGITGRNPGVVHSGSYYLPGTLRARVAVRGNELLWNFCKKYNVAHLTCGKLIIANTERQLSALETIMQSGKENGLQDLVFCDKKRLREMVPDIVAKAGIFSKTTGIVDGVAFTDRLLDVARSNGAIISLDTPFTDAKQINGHWQISTAFDPDYKLKVRFVVNAAGLSAIDLRKKIFPDKPSPTIYWEKGSFVRYTKRNAFKHLVITASSPGFPENRVDCIPGLDGITRFGPIINLTTDSDDFTVSESTVYQVFSMLKNIFPKISEQHLQPCFSGIAPKLEKNREASKDLIIERDQNSGWIDLLGLCSPALSASLAIAEEVRALLVEM